MLFFSGKKCVGVCLAALLFICASSSASLALKQGDPVPDILGRKIKSGFYKLSADGGKPRLINFFSTNCKPCMKEIPELAAYEKKYPRVSFVFVNAEDREPADVTAFVTKLSLVPSNVVCASDMIKQDYQIFGFPYTVIIDAKGKIIQDFRGYSPDNMKQIEKVLSGL